MSSTGNAVSSNNPIAKIRAVGRRRSTVRGHILCHDNFIRRHRRGRGNSNKLDPVPCKRMTSSKSPLTYLGNRRWSHINGTQGGVSNKTPVK